MDALARCYLDSEECAGEESDAVGAYTQCQLRGPPTFITIPKEYWPKHWHGKFTNPVVRLNISLYGHLLAGLYWQQYCHNHLLSLGWEQVKGWECFYMHKEAQLFLSVYVDDFKMAGRKSSLSPMWVRMQKVIDLEPPTPMDGGTYLGCRQREFPIDDDVRKIMSDRQPLVDWCSRKGHQSSQWGRRRKTTCSSSSSI